MIKNRIIQIVYRSMFLAISLFGIIESFGLFYGQEFGFGCFVYYTSLSNFLCFGVMLLVLISTCKLVSKGELTGNNVFMPRLKFYSTIIILVTFLVYNLILADSMFEEGWNNLGNITKHIVCPLLFVFDYFLFDKDHTIKWQDCLLCTILPLIYVAAILIRGAINPDLGYPYFFLNAAELGYLGVFVWVVILVCVFIVIAFLFYLYNCIEVKDGKFKFYLKTKRN